MKPPWLREAESLFKPEQKRGNRSEDAHLYKSHKWRTESSKFTKGYRCEHPNCPVLATVTDHTIPHRQGGAFWDRRNWGRLCDKHHNKKSARERHGIIEPYIETEHGRIPQRNAHLPPDIVGKSYLIKD